MSTTPVYKVDFQVVKNSTASGPGAKDAYRKPLRQVLVQASSAHPKDIMTPLSNNITLGSGESIEILAIQPHVAGSEGGQIWQ